MRCRLGYAVLLGAAVATGAVAAQSPTSTTPTFRSGIDLVTVGVSVRRGNRPVAGLQPADFAVTDNGVPQRISTLSYGQVPFDVTVLFDVSGSVTRGVMDQLRRAMADLRQLLRPEDRLRLVTFNVRVRQVLETSASASDGAVDEAFTTVTPGGGSAVYDALVLALAAGSAPDRRHLVVLFSDGVDTRSVTGEAELLETARAATATVSVVLAAPARSAGDRIYRELVAETGGTFVALLPTETVGRSLREALDQFRLSYVLTYSPAGVARAGPHAIDVTVNRPGLDVRARRGYVVR